jgi:hypothetical protein
MSSQTQARALEDRFRRVRDGWCQSVRIRVMAETQELRFKSLRPLYDFVAKHRLEERPLRKERTPISKEYGQLCREITRAIDSAPGFYLWGSYDPKRYWRSTYLGKAGFGKTTNLRARIFEELKDERWFIWRHVHSKERVLEMSDAIFPLRKHHVFCERAMLKAGATHIIWVPVRSIPNEEITRVETDLIEALSPQVNIRRSTPPNTVQYAATEIFQAFRRTIHASRKTAFTVSLRD